MILQRECVSIQMRCIQWNMAWASMRVTIIHQALPPFLSWQCIVSYVASIYSFCAKYFSPLLWLEFSFRFVMITIHFIAVIVTYFVFFFSLLSHISFQHFFSKNFLQFVIIFSISVLFFRFISQTFNQYHEKLAIVENWKDFGFIVAAYFTM